MNLIFFSYNYPYSQDFSWKRHELSELRNHFNVKLIPFISQNEKPLGNVPDGIEVVSPILNNSIDAKWRQTIISILSPRRFYYYKEFFCEKVYLKKRWILEWLAAVVMIEKVLKHPEINKLLIFNEENINTILYFYWGLGSTYAIPFLRNSGFKKIVVRFHGFDLYNERRGGYLPFRPPLLKNIDYALPISEDGKKYLMTKYPDLGYNVKVCRLGAIKYGDSFPSTDGILRIVSASNVIPLKRLHLISQALQLLSIKCEWSHFGDGVLFEELKSNTKKLPNGVTAVFHGRVTPEEVQNYFVKNPVDLFLNVSSTEGVPVSIMEAFSAGIPVYATHVGGTSEIVNGSNGKLLDKNVTPEKLAQEIEDFSKLSQDLILSFRREALKTYYTKCDFDKLTHDFISFLKE
jgi:colanic acid/amylovoran biosynthesis glycosyltransferase